MGKKEQKLVPLSELTLMDRFLFEEVMEDAEIHRITLEILLGKEISLLDKNEIEKEVRTSSWLRAIRMDASLLEPGVVKFSLLNDTYIIIITPYDVFGLGKYKYTFRARCDEDLNCILPDGAVRVFLNTKGTNSEEVSEELVQFLKYAEKTDEETASQSGSDRIWKIHEHICKIKASEEMGVKYMQKWEERVMDREEAREEGREETLERVNALVKMLAAQNRLDDIVLAANDSAFQEKLFEEFKL